MARQNPINGTISALVTPFADDLSIDFDAFEKLVNFQISSGISGLVISGSTGESATLSTKEKISLFVKAVEISNGRVPIIAGTGSNNTSASVDLTLVAREQGASAVLIVAPYYNKPSQEGLYYHFRAIAEAAEEMPVIIYNVPGRAGINIHAETQLRLAEEFENITATKEASGDLEQMAQIIRHAPEGFELLSGDDALTLPICAIGGKGVISVISNYAPSEFAKMTELAIKGDLDGARDIHYSLLELMKLNFVETSPAPVKTALAIMGMLKPNLRLPLVKMTEGNAAKMRDALVEAGFVR